MGTTRSSSRPLILFVVAALFAGGYALGSNALTGLAVAWCVLLLLGRQRALTWGRALRASREVYPSGFEDDPVVVDLALENHAPRGASLVELLDDFGPAVADRQAVLEPGPLPGRRRRHLRYRTAVSRRWGIHMVGPLRLTVGDVLGLFRVIVSDGRVEPFAVFPRVVEVAALERLGGRPSLAAQERAEARPGQSPLFLGVRDWRSGDDVRRVHWPTFARRGAPAVRELERDLVPYLTLFLDLEKRHRAGTGLKSTLEYLVRTAGSLLWTSVRRGDTVQLFADGAEELVVTPGSGEGHLTHALFELIRVKQEGRTPLLDLVERHRGHLPVGSTLVVLSGTTDLDPARLGQTIEDLSARAIGVAVIAMEAESFAPIDRLRPPADVLRGRREALLAVVGGHGAVGAVLTAEDDLTAALTRPDLLDSSFDAPRRPPREVA